MPRSNGNGHNHTRNGHDPAHNGHNHYNEVTVLIADDDIDDRLLITRAFKEGYPVDRIETVEDGEALMSHLTGAGDGQAQPTLILLDLNMPRKSGFEALQEIKAHPRLRRIPVVIMTTSSSDHDVERCYEAGANAFITKAGAFSDLINLARTIGLFWLEVARRPAPLYPSYS